MAFALTLEEFYLGFSLKVGQKSVIKSHASVAWITVSNIQLERDTDSAQTTHSDVEDDLSG